MQIDRDGTIRFDLFDEMIHTYRVAKNAHSNHVFRDDKGCLFPEISRWLDATGGPTETGDERRAYLATVLFPLAVFRAMAEKLLDDREAEAKHHERPYWDSN